MNEVSVTVVRRCRGTVFAKSRLPLSTPSSLVFFFVCLAPLIEGVRATVSMADDSSIANAMKFRHVCGFRLSSKLGVKSFAASMTRSPNPTPAAAVSWARRSPMAMPTQNNGLSLQYHPQRRKNYLQHLAYWCAMVKRREGTGMSGTVDRTRG